MGPDDVYCAKCSKPTAELTRAQGAPSLVAACLASSLALAVVGLAVGVYLGEARYTANQASHLNQLRLANQPRLTAPPVPLDVTLPWTALALQPAASTAEGRTKTAAPETRVTAAASNRSTRAPGNQEMAAAPTVKAVPRLVARQHKPVRKTGKGTVVVSTYPAVDTYVYLNGGSSLGKAPLRASLPPGRHRLVFFAPSIGGRSVQPVVVRADQTVHVTERLKPRQRFFTTASNDLR